MEFSDESRSPFDSNIPETPQDAHKSLAVLALVLTTVFSSLAAGIFFTLRQDKSTIPCYIFYLSLCVLFYAIAEAVYTLLQLQKMENPSAGDATATAVYEPLRTVDDSATQSSRSVIPIIRENELPPGYEDAIDPTKQLPLPPVDPAADIELQLSSSASTNPNSIFPFPIHLQRTWKALGGGTTTLFLVAPFLMMDAETFPEDPGFRLAWVGFFWIAPLMGWGIYFAKMKQMKSSMGM